MKFTEKKVEIQTDTIINFVRSILTLILLAPYRLFNEISVRIIFLNKIVINRIILVSFSISGIITFIDIASMLYLDSFSLFKGKLPLIIVLFSTVFLAVSYVFISSNNMFEYKQFNPTFSKKTVEEEEMINKNLKEETILTKKDNSYPSYEELSEKLNEFNMTLSCSEFEDDINLDIENFIDTPQDEKNLSIDQDIFEKNEINDYQNMLQDGFSDLNGYDFKCTANYSESEIRRVSMELESSTNPSKFISAEIMELLTAQLNEEDVSFLDGLDIGMIPSNFTLLV